MCVSSLKVLFDFFSNQHFLILFFWNGDCMLVCFLLFTESQVLMFPVLLDDQSLLSEFELFIEAVDNMHELALSGHQQFPVFWWPSLPRHSSIAFFISVFLSLLIVSSDLSGCLCVAFSE